MPLTSDDKNFIIGAIRQVLEEQLEVFEKKLDEKISNLPTKKEFYDRTDETLGRIKKLEEDSDLVQSRVASHEDRITALENKS